MMSGPGRQLGQAQGTQLLAHRLLGEREPELLPDSLDQIDDAPAHNAKDRRVRPGLDDLEQGHPLPFVEQRWLARRLAGLKNAGSSALKRKTQSCTVCKPTPPIAAAAERGSLA
jgi:hypothetical protein